MRSLVDGLWLSATWVERLRDELGLAGLHQVFSESPAWYVWLAGDPGAYGLELWHAEREGPLAHGLLVIKYYPSPGNGLWESFSDEERELAGVCFDQSGTPAFEAREHIAPHLFQVGALEITTNPAREWACYRLSALSRCRQLGPEGELRRNAPGWGLCHALLERLLGLHAYTSKHTPVLAAFGQEPGLELVLEEGGARQAQPCGQTQAYSLSVLFGPEPGRPPVDPAVWQELSPAPSLQGRCEQRAFACGHFHAWAAEAEGKPVLSPLWWSLASVGYTSELATSCGCEHH